jgi:hypothetical protein
MPIYVISEERRMEMIAERSSKSEKDTFHVQGHRRGFRCVILHAPTRCFWTGDGVVLFHYLLIAEVYTISVMILMKVLLNSGLTVS